MAGATTNISIRMDSDLKAQADVLFGELSMNLSTAFNIFVRQALREGGIPFEISLNQPNKETIAAMLEAERIAKDPSVKGYNDLDGDGSEEGVVFVCGAAGDTGGYLVLHSSDDHVYGYRTDYRTFENLKTDGTFIYSDDLGSKEGIATIGFTQNGLVITDVLSATGQAYTMNNFMINGKKVTQEEYNAEKENQDLKNDVEWHEYPIS